MSGAKLSRISQFMKLAGAALALASVATACLPTNNFIKPGAGTSTTGGTSAGSGLDGTAAADNAQPPCTQFDPSTPTRAICVSCYQSILATRCPGKSAFTSCIDPAVQTGYVNLINTCVSQSTQAGFTCPTICTNGLVVNPQTCTCIAPPSLPLGTGVQNIDVGQKDFGPPIVGAIFPASTVLGSPFPNPSITPTATPTSCVGSIQLYMGVQNRGDTIFRLNQYGNPQPSTSPPKNAVLTAQYPTGVPYLASWTAPIQLTTSQLSSNPGANVLSIVNFITGGSNEIIGANSTSTGGSAGNIYTVSGSGSDGTTFSDGVNEAVSPYTGALAPQAVWQSPGFEARDKDGNIFVSDATAGVVDVICYNPFPVKNAGSCTGAAADSPACPFKGQNPFCADVPVGTTVRVAGKAGAAGVRGNDYNTPAAGALLNSPHGIAVDKKYNVYIANSASHNIVMVCGVDTNLLNCTHGNSYVLEGTEGTHGTAPSLLNFPYSVDFFGGKLFIAGYQNHQIFECTLPNALNANNAAGMGASCTSLMGKDGAPGYDTDSNCSGMINTPCLRYPTDVKVNINLNIAVADSLNHVVRGICRVPGVFDFCHNAAGSSFVFPKVVTIAGTPPTITSTGSTPHPGHQGDGAPADLAVISYPKQILVGKRFSDDNGSAVAGIAFDKFADTNVIFTEGLWGTLSNVGFALPTIIRKDGVNPITDIVQLIMGYSHTCMLDKYGKVFCIGDDTYGQLGDGQTSGSSALPSKPVSGASGTIIGGGAAQTCVSSEGSTFTCWGNNGAGQVGVNTVTPEPKPTQAITSAVGAGPFKWGQVVGGVAHTCAYEELGKHLYCFGDNAVGQTGTGATPYEEPTAAAGTWVANANPGGQFASGDNFVCGVYTAATDIIFCFGTNKDGQLGLKDGGGAPFKSGTTKIFGNTTPTGAGTNWVIAAGGSHICAWQYTGGALYCWGSNKSGELGYGSLIPGDGGQSDPTSGVSVVTGITVVNKTPSLTKASSMVAAGLAHTCAATGLGSSTAPPTVFCWGDNSAGQLGNSEVASTIAPLQVVGLPNGTLDGLYANGNQTCAVMDGVNGLNGVVVCWGNNQNSQLGSGPAATIPTGNTVRVVCGDNQSTPAPHNPNIGNSGFCKNAPTPDYTKNHQGVILTIAGQNGQFGNKGAGDGSSAKAAKFAKIAGVTFDLYKNLIVSDGGFTDGVGGVYSDYSLRLINNIVVGARSGLRYSVSDSNGQTSYWCLRLKPLTYCDSEGTCTCAMIPPSDDVDPNFWEAGSSTQLCN